MDISIFNLKKFSNLNKIGTLIPSGEYIGVLNDSTKSRLKDDSIMLKLIWKIKDSRYEGHYFLSYFNMGSEDALKVLFKMISNMGFDAENVKNISELYGHECLLKVKLFNHIIHGKTNIVERYLPVKRNIYNDIPYELLLSNQNLTIRV